MTSGRALIAFFVSLAIALAMIAHVPGAAPAQQPTAGAAATDSAAASRAMKASRAYRIALRFVQRYYPRFISYSQQRQSPFVDRMAAPATISPVYGEVVAINDDTLYASGFLDLRDEPSVVTIPETEANYSVLVANMFGHVIDTGLTEAGPGTYAFTTEDWDGELPAGVEQVELPVDFPLLIFRTDKFSASGEDQIAAAELFRVELRSAPLSTYEEDEDAGRAVVLPVSAFSTRFKAMADNSVQNSTTKFLKTLKKAMNDDTTPRQNKSGRKLIRRFERTFRRATSTHQQARLRAGARDAHAAIVDNYLSNTDRNNWISFEDIGAWRGSHLDRSSIAEYIQWGNGFETSAYFHTFSDKSGSPLNGGIPSPNGYTLTFKPHQIPAAERFWSLTAYTPDDIQPIPNSADKYLVGSYTPGLVTDADGSITIYIAQEKPAGVPEANWLPVSDDLFNLMLRVYGPAGSVAKGEYTPPFVQPVFFP